jgi:hypothetical protein
LLKKGTQQELEMLATQRAERDRYLQQRRAEEGKAVQETQVTSSPKDETQVTSVPKDETQVTPAPKDEAQAA